MIGIPMAALHSLTRSIENRVSRLPSPRSLDSNASQRRSIFRHAGMTIATKTTNMKYGKIDVPFDSIAGEVTKMSINV